MHELAVTQSILDIAIQHTDQKKHARITDVYLVIGQWSSIVDDSVQFYWDMISENTIAQGAKLHFRRIPVNLVCLDCGKKYTPTGEELVCPQCGGSRVELSSGEEFYLEAIDVETGVEVNESAHSSG